MEAPQMRGVEEPLLPEPRAVEGGATQSEGAIETQEARYPRLHKTAGLRSLDVWVEISSLATHPRAIKVRSIPTQYPQLRDDLRDKLSVVEHPNRRALRDRHRHGVRSARYGGGSNVAAAQPKGQL